ncbi:MAG: hypothetical protein KGM24_13040, partial [Elusimicrobia bacterium]|nr:hypothetical protein [Elusimicrobiota bacterium]
MRTQIPTALALLTAALCAAAPAYPMGGSAPGSRSAAAPAPAAAVVSFKNPVAAALNVRRVALEKKIVARLTGRAAPPFAALKGALDVLKSDFRKAVVPKDEREKLAGLLLRDERLLTGGQALARGGSSLDPRVERILAAAARQHQDRAAASIDAVLTQLVSAASSANPASASRIFDGLRSRLGSVPGMSAEIAAVKADFGRKEPIAYTTPSDPLYRMTNAARFSRVDELPPPERSGAVRAAAR